MLGYEIHYFCVWFSEPAQSALLAHGESANDEQKVVPNHQTCYPSIYLNKKNPACHTFVIIMR